MKKLTTLVGRIYEAEKELINSEIEKSWKKEMVGTVKEHKDGKRYRKVSETGNTAQDWKLVSNDQAGVDQTKTAKEHQHKPEELNKFAKNASEVALTNAIKNSPDPKVREAAHKEMDRREKEEAPKKEETKKSSAKQVINDGLKAQYEEALKNDDFKSLIEIGKQLSKNASETQSKEIDQTKFSDKRFTQKVSKKETEALDIYASSKFKEINKEMRDGKVSEENQKTIDLILSAMDKNKLVEDVIVYRGSGGKFNSTGDSFTSTSTSEDTAKNFARGVNPKIEKLIVPKGTPAFYLGGGERELLLPPNWEKQKKQTIKKGYESWL